MTYVRNQTGSKFHLPSCRTLGAGQGIPWHFAAGMSAADLRKLMVTATWLSACKVCRPAGAEVDA